MGREREWNRTLLCVAGLFFLLALSLSAKWGLPHLSQATMLDEWVGVLDSSSAFHPGGGGSCSLAAGA